MNQLKLANLPAIITESQFCTDPLRFLTSKFTATQICYDRKAAVSAFINLSSLWIHIVEVRKECEFAQLHFKQCTWRWTAVCPYIALHFIIMKTTRKTKRRIEWNVDKNLHAKPSPTPHSSHWKEQDFIFYNKIFIFYNVGENKCFHLHCKVTLVCQHVTKRKTVVGGD